MATTTSTGHENRSNGLRKAARLCPLVNQTTISLSRYMRDKALTMEINSDSVRMVGNRPSAEYAMNNITSCGLIKPRDAWPKVRISTMVITMVTKTTTVAPKLRASSLRIEDWNNIALGCRFYFR